MSKAIEAIGGYRGERGEQPPPSQLPSLVGRSLHQTELDCPHWGRLASEDAMFPTVRLTADCMSHSALAGILVAQHGDSASHRPGPGRHVHL